VQLGAPGVLIAGGWRRLGRRAVFTAGAYLAAAIVIVLTFFVLKGRVGPHVLQGLLGYFFIASTTAGLEPGTVKAAALANPKGRTDVLAITAVSALKGLAAAPIVALVWRFSDPSIGLATLAWTAGLCVAGFAATDLRVMFDLDGRHATAIWIKQGSLATGLAVVAVMTWLGAPLALGVGVSTALRLIFAAAAAAVAATTQRAHGENRERPLAREIRRLLAERRWVALAGASVVAAVSGGADRVFGLRYLSAEAWSGYYLTFEVFSKFWFIPYLLGPIVFARRVSDGPGGAFPGQAERLTLGAGVLFTAAVAVLVVLAPRALTASLRLPIGAPTLAFAAAIVVSSITQLRVLGLQAAGAARSAFAAMGLSAIVSTLLFLAGARVFGASGLMATWLIKSILELAAITLAARLARRVA